MKIFLNTIETENGTLKVTSATQRRPAGDNVYAVHIDEGLRYFKRQKALGTELRNLTGRNVKMPKMTITERGVMMN